MLPILVPATLFLAQVPVVQRADDGRLVARSAGYEARFDAAGMAFGEPNSLPAVSLGAREVRRGDARVALADGATHTSGARVSIERGLGVVEHFDARADGIEHSLVLDGPVGASGDLVVRVELGGANAQLGERLADGSHQFGDVSYGRLFGIDADGDRVDGDVRLVDGGFELVLPAAFVDTADWPITLDPLIALGSAITLPSGVDNDDFGESDHENDCAYDATTGWYLHVWRRRTKESVAGPFGTTITVTKERVMYRRLSTIGNPVGTELELTNNDSYAPRVASVNRHDTFAVTWLEDVGDETRLMYRVYAASTGVATSAAIVIATAPLGEIAYHDLAGESSPSPLVAGRAFVVWVDAAGALELARVDAFSASAPSIGGITTIAAPGLFETWHQVSVARCTNSEGRLVIAAVREGTLTGSRRVVALTIDRNGTVLTAPATISGPDIEVLNPSVDGGGAAPSRWVVAWDEGAAGFFGATFDLRAAALQVVDSPSVALTAGTAVTLGTASQEFQPSVGWRPGMAIVAARNESDIDVRMLCDTTAAVGEAPSTVFASSNSGFLHTSGGLPTVVLRSSGGNTSEHEGLILWRRAEVSTVNDSEFEIWRRRYDAFDPNATTSILALGCGNVGVIDVPTPPAIGNPDFRIELTGAKPGAAIAILNIAAPAPLATCGPCSFAALETLFILPIVGGEATKALPIPCNAALAGAKADVQWIVYEPGIAPCTPVPDFGATGLLRLTLN
jgi:hypothetical protein